MSDISIVLVMRGFVSQCLFVDSFHLDVVKKAIEVSSCCHGLQMFQYFAEHKKQEAVIKTTAGVMSPRVILLVLGQEILLFVCRGAFWVWAWGLFVVGRGAFVCGRGEGGTFWVLCQYRTALSSRDITQKHDHEIRAI